MEDIFGIPGPDDRSKGPIRGVETATQLRISNIEDRNTE